MSKTYTITAALPYTNGPIHIGHLSGVYIPADIYARFLRITGNDVIYICGSDEHGVPITIKAKNENKTPQEIVDRYHKNIKESFEEFGISFDNYSRTSEKIHHKTASDFFLKLHNNGSFKEITSEQYYDKEENQFLPDRFLIGICPKCGFEESYGDQCEKCGTSHNSSDLINPKSSITGNVPSLKSTKHWFLKLDSFQEFLKKWILEENKNFWKPNVYGQCKSWLDDGLKPRAVTRDLEWGVPVPIKEATGKVLYVWFDAPIGYISSTIEWAEKEKIDWKPYWQDSETELVHFIGKDNIVFHCIIFPSILKASGKYILPTNVPANEFLNLEGKKISTSKNWAIWLDEYIKDFPEMQDTLRYVLTANAPENKDNDFTWKDFQAKNNNELVAIFGNFINRVVVLTQKYYDGKTPSCQVLNEKEKDLIDQVYSYPKKIGESIEKYKFREAINTMIDLARLGNKYLAEEEPWKVIKTESSEKVKTIMNISIQICGVLSLVCEPFLPNTSVKLKKQFNIQNIEWDSIIKSNPVISNEVQQSELIFRKIEDEEIIFQLEKLNDSKQ